jgi:hypothetical protein
MTGGTPYGNCASVPPESPSCFATWRGTPVPPDWNYGVSGGRKTVTEFTFPGQFMTAPKEGCHPIPASLSPLRRPSSTPPPGTLTRIAEPKASCLSGTPSVEKRY